MCYLVGAGLSAASRFCAPVSKGFFSRTFTKHCDGQDREIILSSEDPELSGLLDRLESYYGPLDELDLEDVMSDVYLRAFGIGSAWGWMDFSKDAARYIPDLHADYRLLIRYIRERLPAVENTKLRCERVAGVVDLIRQHDSVVTLNYDTILERHLADKGTDHLKYLESSIVPPGSSHGGAAKPTFRRTHPKDRGVFVRLHGSKDWYTCSNEACTNHAHVFPNNQWYSTTASRMNEEGPFVRCSACGSSRVPVIVPPTPSKSFEAFPKLGYLWSQSYEALRPARFWVLLGVSLARTDFHLSSLLRISTRPRMNNEPFSFDVCIVNRDRANVQDVAQRPMACLSPQAQQAFGEGRPIYSFNSIEEYFDAARCN